MLTAVVREYPETLLLSAVIVKVSRGARGNGCQTLQQVAQRSGRVTILGAIKET